MKNFTPETYVTLLAEDVRVGDRFLLKKEVDNRYDDEAILAFDVTGSEDYASNETPYDDISCYVANSVKTVAKGTFSAGRIYDKFENALLVEAKFVLRDSAICLVLKEIIEN